MNLVEFKKIFMSSLLKFSRENWWAYIIFILCTIIIFYTGTWNIFEILIVFFIQFFGSLLWMMMSDSYSKNDNISGTIFLVISTIIYCWIWIYWWFERWQWQYLLPQIIFIILSIKSTSEILFKKEIRIINFNLILIINIILLVCFYYLWTTKTIWGRIQITSLFLTTQALTLNSVKYKYLWITSWWWLLTLWSLILVVTSFYNKSITWLDISYAILPMTSFVFQLKLFRNVFPKK